MNNSAIATDYAKVLFEACLEKNIQTKVLYQTRELKKIQDEEIRKILNIPIISKENKIELIQQLEKFNIEPLIINLLKILVKRNNFKYFGQILDEYQNLYQKHEGILVINVTTANPLSKKNFDLLLDELEKKLSKSLVLLTEVDPELIGGVKIKYDSKEIDNTIKKYLRDFITQL